MTGPVQHWGRVALPNELEDAEAKLVEQEKWGFNRVGLGLRLLTAAVRLLRSRVVAHEQRLDAMQARLDRLDPPTLPPP